MQWYIVVLISTLEKLGGRRPILLVTRCRADPLFEDNTILTLSVSYDFVLKVDPQTPKRTI